MYRPTLGATLMTMLTRQGRLAQEQRVSDPADLAEDSVLRNMQAASRIDPIALGPHAGQGVLSLQTVPDRDQKTTT